MILPITIYGMPVLRKEAVEIDSNYANLSELIANMFETMRKADGVGLAAPQVNLSIRLFVIDTTPMADDENPELENFYGAFINPKIIEFSEDMFLYNEGCLSVPGVREDVKRPESIRIQYYDADFVFHDEVFTGIKARVIQHEYDHLDGFLFTDRVSPIKKQLLKAKLTRIVKGKFSCNYKSKSIVNA